MYITFQTVIPAISYPVIVKKRSKKGRGFEIDELTNSIRNVVTGDSFSTDITLVTSADLTISDKKSGWHFDWRL
jgi:hypothetical protein